ncbi:hypothetical protein MANES_05G016750v8 [Manihot esculenta]|uniref:Uncharacterized protein n=1 Tax=Manihot esculenta TaxID=3983 RepID=A0ACB7HNP6_MANES|nr:hypothetical protein MANES_05G016750v8 [Manihot esculenta]
MRFVIHQMDRSAVSLRYFFVPSRARDPFLDEIRCKVTKMHRGIGREVRAGGSRKRDELVLTPCCKKVYVSKVFSLNTHFLPFQYGKIL